MKSDEKSDDKIEDTKQSNKGKSLMRKRSNEALPSYERNNKENNKNISVKTDSSVTKAITLAITDNTKATERRNILQEIEKNNKTDSLSLLKSSLSHDEDISLLAECSNSSEMHDIKGKNPITPAKTNTSENENNNSCNHSNNKLTNDSKKKSVSSKSNKGKKKHYKHSQTEGVIEKLGKLENQMNDLQQQCNHLSQMVQQILDYWNEHRDTPSNMESLQLERKTGFPLSGFNRISDDTIHLGQGIFIPKKYYDAVAVRAKSGSQFVRNILIILFTEEELKNSSLYGEKSNKIKVEEQKPALDATKLQAIKDIYSYYLKQGGVKEESIPDEIKKVDCYIRSKIGDLRREARRSEKKSMEPARVPPENTKKFAICKTSVTSNDSEDTEISSAEQSSDSSENSDEEEVHKTVNLENITEDTPKDTSGEIDEEESDNDDDDKNTKLDKEDNKDIDDIVNEDENL